MDIDPQTDNMTVWEKRMYQNYALTQYDILSGYLYFGDVSLCTSRCQDKAWCPKFCTIYNVLVKVIRFIIYFHNTKIDKLSHTVYIIKKLFLIAMLNIIGTFVY